MKAIILQFLIVFAVIAGFAIYADSVGLLEEHTTRITGQFVDSPYFNGTGNQSFRAYGNWTFYAHNATHSADCYWYFDANGNYTLHCE